MANYIYSTELYHHGIKGQKWGVRNYQNSDGSLTPEGREHYGVGEARYHQNEGIHRLDSKPLSERKQAKLDYYKTIQKQDAAKRWEQKRKDNEDYISRLEKSNANKRKFRENSKYANKFTKSVSEANEAVNNMRIKSAKEQMEEYKKIAEAEMSYIENMSYKDMKAETTARQIELANRFINEFSDRMNDKYDDFGISDRGYIDDFDEHEFYTKRRTRGFD